MMSISSADSNVRRNAASSHELTTFRMLQPPPALSNARSPDSGQSRSYRPLCGSHPTLPQTFHLFPKSSIHVYLLQKLWWCVRTFCAQGFGVLVNQWLAPAPYRVHDFHVKLSLCGEAGDCLAIDDRLAGSRVDYSCKDGSAVAAVRECEF